MGEIIAKAEEEVAQDAKPVAGTKNTSTESITAGPQEAPASVESGDSSLPESNPDSGKAEDQSE